MGRRAHLDDPGDCDDGIDGRSGGRRRGGRSCGRRRDAADLREGKCDRGDREHGSALSALAHLRPGRTSAVEARAEDSLPCWRPSCRRQRPRELGRDADLRVGDAQALDFPDERFDSVVCTLSLCTIPDDRAAVAEVRRVLRPGGRFLLLEHVRSPVLPIRVAERLLEPLMLRFEGDHLLREPLDHLRVEGFEIERLERSKLGIVERVAARRR